MQKDAEHLAWIGVFRVTTAPGNGKDRFFMQIFATGIMEMMVNNAELLEKHPEVGRAFEEYTRIRMATMAPMMPNGYGLMRVVPIESAIEGIPNVRDDEKLSYYLCTTKCMFDAIKLEKTREWHAGEFETMPIKVAEHLVRRTGKIAAKAVSRK